MSSIESFARIAFALRNDRAVRRRVPAENEAFCDSVPRPMGRTLSTICLTTLPSFFSNFCGLAVL